MLKELGQMDFEKQGLSTLKFLSSDDRGYTVEMPVKDEETGRFRNVQYKIPAITVISSTTRLILDPQFERRTWLFNVDESKEQTERVALWKAKRQKQENEKLVRAREYTDYEFSKEVIKRFVKQLKPVRVIIPFPETLTVLLGYDILRVRGDLDKVYNFLKFYGMFNIKRLQKIKGRAIYLLTPEICVEALKLIVNPLTNMLSRMDERAKLILTALEEVSDVEEKTINLQTGETVEVEKKYCYKGSEITKKVREKIAAKIGKSDRTVRAFLSFLESTAGVVSSDGGVGRTPKTFTLLYSTEEIRKKISGILEKLESANKLMPEMEEEAQNWLSSLSEIKTPRNGYNFTQSFGVVTKTPSQNNIPHPKDSISNNDLSTPKRSLPEASEDSWHNKKRSTIQGETIKKEGTPPSTTDIKTDKTPFPILKREEHKHKITMGDGQVLFQCPVCEKFNKPMFFTNQHDLDLHLMRLHSGYPIQVKADNSPATETAPEIKPEMSAEFSDEKVVSVRDLDPPLDQRKCARCHKPKTLPKQAEYSDGAWAPICDDCGLKLEKQLEEV